MGDQAIHGVGLFEVEGQEFTVVVVAGEDEDPVVSELVSGVDALVADEEVIDFVVGRESVQLFGGVLAWVFIGRLDIALVFVLAMVLNMTLAGMVGAFIPLMLKELHFDPAQSSSIFLTAVTDISGFLIFLWLGKTFLLGG